MLCRNTYADDYIDTCRVKVAAQVAAYRDLVEAARAGDTGATLDAAIDAFEPVFFNALILALDGYFVHRSRMLELKDGNPLNEVRVLCTSLTQGDGTMGVDRSIRLDATTSVLGYGVGDTIAVREEQFARLADGFFAELERKFREPVAAP